MSLDLLIKHKLERAVKRSFKEGKACRYLEINDQFGLKLYKNKKIADFTYFCQSRACGFGLAPKIYGRFNCVWQNWQYYGYVTENAGLTYHDWYFRAHNIVNACNLPMHYWDFFSSLENRLIEELREIGITGMDFHEDNCVLRGDKLICIDFSHCYYNDYDVMDLMSDSSGPNCITD